jgi:Trk K+ transport system NAD-binding subunit
MFASSVGRVSQLAMQPMAAGSAADGGGSQPVVRKHHAAVRLLERSGAFSYFRGEPESQRRLRTASRLPEPREEPVAFVQRLGVFRHLPTTLGAERGQSATRRTVERVDCATVSDPSSARAPTGQAVLVCGLGRVGRQCVQALRGYNVPVRAIDLKSETEMGLDLEPGAMTQGDFRELSTLLRAGVGDCRSIVLLSSDPTANVEGALAARRANSEIRLVIRAQEHGWHSLLAKQLGNLVVYEPNRLSAATFALAALDSEVLAHFYVDGRLFQVLEHEVLASDPFVGHPVDDIHPAGRQILGHTPADATKVGRPETFYGWEPERTVASGDRLLMLGTGGTVGGFTARSLPPGRGARAAAVRFGRRFLPKPDKRLERPARVALIGLAGLATLMVFATSMFSLDELDLPLSEAVRVALQLLFGGHLADVFEHYETLPASVHWLELLLVMSGTVLTAVIYALLTDLLLRARFDLRAQRPNPPTRDHVIVAGLGQTGIRIASLLEQLKRKVVAIEASAVEPHVLPHLAIVGGNPADERSLLEAHLLTARGLVAATSDDQHNVEIALLASTLNPACRIAVRTFDPRFRENVAFLLPEARVLCVSSLAATAYAAAALGENVINLFQTPQGPVLVVEYDVSAGDTLVNRPLWEIAEGYAVVPVLHQRPGSRARVPGPDEATLVLKAADRLVVLATAGSLEAIERGDLRPARYQLLLERLRPYAESLQVVGMLSQRLGYTLEHARSTLESLPQIVPIHLYGLYASRTARLLNANGVETRVVERDSVPELEALRLETQMRESEA